MTNLFSEFTNQYSINKTLRFFFEASGEDGGEDKRRV